MTAQLVASDIENMQVQYGVATPAASAVRFYALLRRRERRRLDQRGGGPSLAARAEHDAEPGYTNTSSYAMGDQTVTGERRLPAPGLPAGRADTQMNSRGQS